MRHLMLVRAASLTGAALILTLASPVFAQRAFDCNSEDAKKLLLRALAKHYGDKDPYPGVMAWWPKLLPSVKMVSTSTGNRMQAKQYTIDGSNYAFFLDRSPSRHLNLYVQAMNTKANVTLGITACSYTTPNGRSSTLKDLRLFDSKTMTLRSADPPFGQMPGKLLKLTSGKHKGERDHANTPYTVLILSPSYFTGSQRYQISYGVGGEFRFD